MVVSVRGSSEFTGRKVNGKRPLPEWCRPNAALNNMQVTEAEWGGTTRNWSDEVYYRFLSLFFGSLKTREKKHDVANFLRQEMQASTKPTFLPEHITFVVGLLDVSMAQLLAIYDFGT
jgi:hypothetical protein